VGVLVRTPTPKDMTAWNWPGMQVEAVANSGTFDARTLRGRSSRQEQDAVRGRRAFDPEGDAKAIE
jgi:hypothetical protein